MRIVILSSDNYFKKHQVSLDEILSYGEYGEFLGDAISKGLKPVKALRMLYKNGSSFLELRERLKKHDISVELYFIAPFGVLRENDLIIPYAPKLNELTMEKLAFFFTENNIIECVQKILEEEPDIIIIALPYKIIKALGVLSYISRNTIAIIISDKVSPMYERNIGFLVNKPFSPKTCATIISKLLRRILWLAKENKIKDILAERSANKLISNYLEERRDLSLMKYILQGEKNDKKENCNTRRKALFSD